MFDHLNFTLNSIESVSQVRNLVLVGSVKQSPQTVHIFKSFAKVLLIVVISHASTYMKQFNSTWR
jgi:hypothetical protein